MNTQHRLDDKLMAVLIVTWSVVLAVASVDTFCGRVAAPSATMAAQVARPAGTAVAQARPSTTPATVRVASTR